MQCARRLDSFSCIFLNRYMLCFGQVWVSMCQRANCLLVFTPTNKDFTDKSLPSVWRCANQWWSHLVEWNPANLSVLHSTWLSTQVNLKGHKTRLISVDDSQENVFSCHLDELHWGNQTVEGTKVLTTNRTSSLWNGMLLYEVGRPVVL